MTLNWLAEAVTARLRLAQVKGVNATMAAAVSHAKRNHDWKNRTATLEGSIDITEFARTEAIAVRGLWGSRDVRYALIHELGGTIEPVSARALFIRDAAGEISAVVPSVEIKARPYLRPAADAEYPKLAGRIRAAYEGGSA